MRDSLFIEQMLNKGREATERVKKEFPALTLAQLNWKPSAESWSIGQCLDHLVTSDCLYFPTLKKITEGEFQMRGWEKWSPFSGLFGRVLIHMTQEAVTKKSKTARILTPSSSSIDMGIFERFHKHQDSLLGYFAACKNADLDRTLITSPVSKFITYSLRHTITVLIPHQHRHINQAIRVKQAKDFPAT